MVIVQLNNEFDFQLKLLVNFLFKDIFANAFETSNVLVAHPYSLSC